ncbi:MAG TPA: hypothetical protein VMF89_33785 [Polyangiales bacterium]|nr:hypothetical protein [Polyangiales bacterium]
MTGETGVRHLRRVTSAAISVQSLYAEAEAVLCDAERDIADQSTAIA